MIIDFFINHNLFKNYMDLLFIIIYYNSTFSVNRIKWMIIDFFVNPYYNLFKNYMELSKYMFGQTIHSLA
jgi:hypothetical protein